MPGLFRPRNIAGGGQGVSPVAPPSASFSTPSALWVVNHNLGYIPSVTVVDNQGNELLIEKKITTNQIIITPNQPITGKVIYG